MLEQKNNIGLFPPSLFLRGVCFYFLLLVFFFRLNDAAAFTLIDDTEPRWPDNEVTLNFNSSSCASLAGDIGAQIEEGIKLTWNSVAYSYFKINNGTNNGIANSTDFDNGTIQVFCTDLGDSSILGQTGTSFNGNGEITRAFFQINTGAEFSSDQTLQLTIAHEIGHAIGFGHSAEEAALMFFQLGSGQERLSRDDVDAMTYLYNQNDITDGVMGCGVLKNIYDIGNDNDDSPFGGSAIPFAILLTLISFGSLVLRQKRVL